MTTEQARFVEELKEELRASARKLGQLPPSPTSEKALSSLHTTIAWVDELLLRARVESED